MSNENRISVMIPEEALSMAMQHFVSGAQIMTPYLINLTPEQRKELPKLGDKSTAFVIKGIDYLHTPTSPIPSYVNVPELEIDFKLIEDLRKLLQVIMPTIDMIDDTMTLAGSDTYMSVLAFYSYIKGAAKLNVPGAQTIYDDMSERFSHRTAKLPTPA